MNLRLTRTSAALYGVLGELTSNDTGMVFGPLITLEHAFSDGAAFVPKLATGTYTCKRGVHRLSNLVPFETFEVMEVPDFQGNAVTGILFHKGNYNRDSEGCILLGSEKGTGCILESEVAFNHFMATQSGVDTFTLTVT